jgi:hypothetical protein
MPRVGLAAHYSVTEGQKTMWAAFFLHLLSNSGATISDIEATIDRVQSAHDVPTEVTAGLQGAIKVLNDAVGTAPTSAA